MEERNEENRSSEIVLKKINKGMIFWIKIPLSRITQKTHTHTQMVKTCRKTYPRSALSENRAILHPLAEVGTYRVRKAAKRGIRSVKNS